jgi:hypothetical protein
MKYASIGLGDPAPVRFNYDPEIVSLLKSVAPSHARKWDRSTKTWFVDRLFINVLTDQFRACGIHVLVEETPANHPPRQCANWAAELFRAVGRNRIGPVHRALTKVLHPDTATGSAHLQQELNDARAQLERNY